MPLDSGPWLSPDGATALSEVAETGTMGPVNTRLPLEIDAQYTARRRRRDYSKTVFCSGIP
jgi:hypothetical protein